MEWFLERVKALDVAVRPPEPLLQGRDLLALGLAPGPEMGGVLRAVYELQLDGAVTTSMRRGTRPGVCSGSGNS